jgi:hypothetical protein
VGNVSLASSALKIAAPAAWRLCARYFPRRKPNEFLSKIKNAADVVYEKPNGGVTAGTDPKNLAITGDTQS